MKNIFKSMAFVALTAIAMTSCTSSDNGYDNVSTPIKTYNMTKTIEVAAVPAPTTPALYAADDIIEAYVTSNDAAGNFYKSISFQTIPTDATAPIGFSVSVNKTMLFADGFTPGRKVYIKLKDLTIGKVFGSMQMGVADATSTTGIGGIPALDVEKHLFPADLIVAEDTFVRHVSLAVAATDPYQNTLLEVDNVEFADNSITRTYFDIDSGGYATNHDIVSTTGGTTRYCRVSQYAPFSVHAVPSGRGSIRGVMTKYSSDFQFLVRSESDFKLNNPRTYTSVATLNENFNSYAANQVAFANYLNFATVGTKKWLVKTVGAVTTLQMSAFGGAMEHNAAYFIIPVDMTAASTLKFDLKSTFYTGALGFKLYRTMDYVPGQKLSKATLYDISSNLSQPMPVAVTTLNGLTYNIPANVTGNGYFVFEYTGNNVPSGPPVTTTIDIDNIIIN